MSNFKFAKTMLGINPDLAKETVLSKIVSMVDVFMVNLSDGFDDNNKKFLDTIMKLDHSKSMMLETRWLEIRVRNISNFELKKWDKIKVEYSEYTQENDSKIFINYRSIQSLKKWDKITFLQSNITCTVLSVEEDSVECKIENWGTLFAYDRTVLPVEHTQDLFEQRNEKDILRALEYNVHMIAVSDVQDQMNIIQTKSFLQKYNKENMKVFAKIQNEAAVDNIDNILEVADGLIIVINQIQDYIKDRWITVEEFLSTVREKWKPMIVSYYTDISSKKYELKDPKTVQGFCELWVDWFLLETIIHEDNIYDTVESIHKNITKYQNKSTLSQDTFGDNNSDQIVRDYIIYNAYRASTELEIKAIVCFTDSGYTPAKLVSMWPNIPIITFTKKEETYRYLNTIWWVKWYKISPSFDYENLKKIWKEMIRIIFKWNISLEDKILIVQANESISEKSDMINGLELYKFKNI